MELADGAVWALPDNFWSWVLVAPFVIGILSGGQTIFSKLGNDFLGILHSVWGWIYWLSRGLIPLAAYVSWFLLSQTPSRHSIGIAFACGLGSEGVLRTRLYFGTQKVEGKSTDWFVGLFDLVAWWQAWCLRRAAIAHANSRIRFVRKLMESESDFNALCQRVRANTGAYSTDLQDELNKNLANLQKGFSKELADTQETGVADLHKVFISRLGYALLASLGNRASVTRVVRP